MTHFNRSRFNQETCTIKRVALSTTTGATSLPTVHLASVPCTPLLPRGGGMITAGRLQEEGMGETLQKELYVFGNYDIVKGDTVVLNGAEFSVWDSHLWNVSRDPFLALVLNEVQAVKPAEAEFIR